MWGAEARLEVGMESGRCEMKKAIRDNPSRILPAEWNIKEKTIAGDGLFVIF